jgi:hypothetical protein
MAPQGRAVGTVSAMHSTILHLSSLLLVRMQRMISDRDCARDGNRNGTDYRAAQVTIGTMISILDMTRMRVSLILL